MLTEMPIPKNILSTFPHRLRGDKGRGVKSTPYPESATRWLISLLDLFTGIINRNENLSHIVVTETEYQQLSEVMDDLIYSVGEDENHPLSATMTLVGVLIKIYEDQHFPKLETLFPERAEGSTVESANKTVMQIGPYQNRLRQISSSFSFRLVVCFGRAASQKRRFLHTTWQFV